MGFGEVKEHGSLIYMNHTSALTSPKTMQIAYKRVNVPFIGNLQVLFVVIVVDVDVVVGVDVNVDDDVDVALTVTVVGTVTVVVAGVDDVVLMTPGGNGTRIKTARAQMFVNFVRGRK